MKTDKTIPKNSKALKLVTWTLPLCIAILALTPACKDKKEGGDEGSADEKSPSVVYKMVPTKIDALGVTMMAPKGAKIRGDKRVTISEGRGFGVVLTKDIFGAKGDSLIIPFEKKRMVKKLVDKPTLQVWTKEMGGKTVVLFAMAVKVGDKKLYVQSDGMGMYTKEQIDTMIKAVKSLKPAK